MSNHLDNPYSASGTTEEDVVRATSYEPNSSPTSIRYQVVAVSVLMAFILYLDRVCLAEIVKSSSFLDEMNVSKEKIGGVLGAFFFTYALMQIPSGWASDRFGARRMLTIYIVLWSLMTAFTGLATSIGGILIARLACGVGQAGAYPTSSGVIRKWFSLDRRATASSCISFGGRLGGALAPYITALLILQLSGWRPVLFIYGLIGIFIAVAYWLIVRDSPSDHSGVNDAERSLIGKLQDDRKTSAKEILPMLGACTLSRSLWLSSVSQFCVNIGWAFLITWLPTYLKESKGVDPVQGAAMVSGILAIGMLGQLIGGWASDRSVAIFGLRWGRVLPLAMSSTIAGIAYLICPFLDSVWLIVACCAIVSLMTDVGNPSFWAFMQDVGGRNTSAIYGWSNMWGNLGTALSAIMVPQLMKWGETSGNGQLMVFFACGTSFFVAAIAVLGMDSTKTVQK